MSFPSSSSECVCECINKESLLKPPLYPNLVQPIIYYAQVKPQSPGKSADNKKRMPNCFVKAFRWYTQEHVPSRETTSNKGNAEMIGFASWLDNKYNEFLQNSQLDQAIYHFKLNDGSSTDANNLTTNTVYETGTRKKFSTMQGPWRKRRRLKSKDDGDVCKKSNRSFEYILQPKDLHCPASEHCHLTSCCDRSNAAFLSSETPNVAKKLIKSQSLTSVRQEFHVTPALYTPIEATVNENLKIKENTVEKEKTTEKSQLHSKKSTFSQTANKVNIECQCSIDNLKKRDEQTQYEVLQFSQQHRMERPSFHYKYHNRQIVDQPNLYPSTPQNIPDTKIPKLDLNKTLSANLYKKLSTMKEQKTQREYRRKLNTSCECSVESVVKVNAENQYEVMTLPENSPHYNYADIPVLKETPSHRETFVQKSQLAAPYIRRLSRPTTKQEQQDINEHVDKIATLLKSSSLIISINNSAQTSDLSINIENDTIHEYPLFMKIICADKLHDNNIHTM